MTHDAHVANPMDGEPALLPALGISVAPVLNKLGYTCETIKGLFVAF
jgi:hypothetical protein